MEAEASGFVEQHLASDLAGTLTEALAGGFLVRALEAGTPDGFGAGAPESFAAGTAVVSASGFERGFALGFAAVFDAVFFLGALSPGLADVATRGMTGSRAEGLGLRFAGV